MKDCFVTLGDLVENNKIMRCSCGKELFVGHIKICVKCGKTICPECMKMDCKCKDCFNKERHKERYAE